MNSTARTILIASVSVCLLAGGCASTQTTPSDGEGGAVISEQGYTGPAVTIESHTPSHTVVVTTPSGGWSLLWDEKSASGEEIYLTIRQPDPAFFHVQQIVPHRLDSTVANSARLKVFVRVAAHDGTSESEAYSLAAESN